LLAPDHPAFERVRSYLARQAEDVRTVVECFNVLNACRLLRAATDSRPTFEPPTERFDALLRGQLLPRGGMARSLGETRVSAYHTFLGSLCYQMLGQTMPVFDDAVRAIETLAHFDGGFAELEGQAAAQTNATSAAVAFLAMHNALTSERAAEARRFLSAMQGADGGLKAHADAATGDLLSTFTGFVAMASLGGLPQDAASGIAAFLRDVALFDGGFLACPGDDAADVEYTYYGLGVFSLLRRPSPFGEKTGY
jgi:hypothetical protein